MDQADLTCSQCCSDIKQVRDLIRLGSPVVPFILVFLVLGSLIKYLTPKRVTLIIIWLLDVTGLPRIRSLSAASCAGQYSDLSPVLLRFMKIVNSSNNSIKVTLFSNK